MTDYSFERMVHNQHIPIIAQVLDNFDPDHVIQKEFAQKSLQSGVSELEAEHLAKFLIFQAWKPSDGLDYIKRRAKNNQHWLSISEDWLRIMEEIRDFAKNQYEYIPVSSRPGHHFVFILKVQAKFVESVILYMFGAKEVAR